LLFLLRRLRHRNQAAATSVMTRPPTEAAYGCSCLRIKSRCLSKALNTPVRADRKPSASLTLWPLAARRSMTCRCLTIRSFAPAMCSSAWVRWANSSAMMALPFPGGSATGLSATGAWISAFAVDNLLTSSRCKSFQLGYLLQQFDHLTRFGD